MSRFASIFEAAAKVKDLFGARAGEWDLENVILPVETIDGEFTSGDVLCRKVRGKKQYKKLSAIEREQFQLDREI